MTDQNETTFDSGPQPYVFLKNVQTGAIFLWQGKVPPNANLVRLSEKEFVEHVRSQAEKARQTRASHQALKEAADVAGVSAALKDAHAAAEELREPLVKDEPQPAPKKRKTRAKKKKEEPAAPPPPPPIDENVEDIVVPSATDAAALDVPMPEDFEE